MRTKLSLSYSCAFWLIVICKIAVTVTVNMYIRNLDEVNDNLGSYRAQITFREEWNDPRLSYSGKAYNEFIPITDSSLIWTPDLFFSNALEGSVHKTLASNQMIRVYPNGNVLFSSRLTLKLKCPLVAPSFPFDRNNCSIKIASYAYTTDDLVLVWKSENPVQVGSKLDVPGFRLSPFETTTGTSKTNTGAYGYLEASFRMCRDPNYYYIMVYIPCCMLVIVSYLAFWVKDKYTKYLIALAALFVSAVMISFVNISSMPRTSYTKAIDVWTGISLTFTFATLVILVVFDNLIHDKTEGETGECLINGKAGEPTSSGTRRQCNTSNAEKMARLFYPIAFAVFLIFYFLICLLIR